MTASNLRIGLLGCGAISQFAHLPALIKAKGVSLAALCDTAEDLLKILGHRYGIERLYTRPEDLFGDTGIDAVLIAVPDPFHVILAEQALRAGKHVLVENHWETSPRIAKGLQEQWRRQDSSCKSVA